ncbi:MAG: metal-binding protein [Deltaproteobacteria bacterium]|nr:metal-binding protein [Deltaproteobacteria bacterium]
MSSESEKKTAGQKPIRNESGTDVFNQNLNCPYFPCHGNVPAEVFNCKHCYCPLYFIFPENCGGEFRILPSGIKDCSGCGLPHGPGGHEHVLAKLREHFGRIAKTDHDPAESE